MGVTDSSFLLGVGGLETVVPEKPSALGLAQSQGLVSISHCRHRYHRCDRDLGAPELSVPCFIDSFLQSVVCGCAQYSPSVY